ncbi:MAG: D-2-hydroxyacid dehydrogenase [Opitutaceae bacterium]|jgi:phosphoglycerate dehydrogenase-like enzyme
MPLTIWCNSIFNDEATRRLKEGLRGHKLIASPHSSASVLDAGRADPSMAEADVAFGQPDVADCLDSRRLRWLEVSTAGYTRYDTEEFREAFRSRGMIFTTASAVFADSCAHHVLAMMLAQCRQLLPSYRDQVTDQSWHHAERRHASRRMTGSTVLMLGFGAIGRRLAALLAPFGCALYAVRRQTRSELGARVIAVEDLTRVLPLADHVVNILPENEATRDFVNARRLSCFKPGAVFYNVGRGSTVDQQALLESLHSRRLGAAYLDVTTPEPLSPGDPLWTAPNCFITPHTAGGRNDQDEALVEHFLANLSAFERGEPMVDRAI